MLKELRDFIYFESSFGLRVLLNDLIAVNKVFFQKKYLQNILDFAKKRNLKFTFFVSAKNLDKRKQLISRLLKEDHEIASHSYNHLLLNQLPLKGIEKEFKLAKNNFNRFNIKVKGFRAPFLSFNEKVLGLLKRYNFSYSSNKIGGRSFNYENGIKEIPIIKPYDWYGLIVEKQTIDTLIAYWKQKNGCCYLFHPWIINRYLNKIDRFLGKNRDYRIISNLRKNRSSVSFDVY